MQTSGIVKDGRLELVRIYDTDGKSALLYNALTPTDARFSAESISELTRSQRAGPAFVSRVVEMFPELSGTVDQTMAQDEMKLRIQELADSVPPDQKTAADQVLPTGIDKSIDAMLPDVIYIPAVKDLADDIKTAETTPFGKILAIGGTRHGGPVDTVPSRAFHGYLAALINRQGGSDCETFALGFKEFGLGPVIGTRTWGGWVGIRGDKPLRDGGLVTQPEFGGWDPHGKEWIIEGHGVDPEIELDLEPDGFLGGKDLQLDRAIDLLLKKIALDPRDLPAPPPIVRCTRASTSSAGPSSRPTRASSRPSAPSPRSPHG